MEAFGVPSWRSSTTESITLEGINTFWETWEVKSKVYRVIRNPRQDWPGGIQASITTGTQQRAPYLPCVELKEMFI